MTESSFWRRAAVVAVLASALPAAHAADVNARIRGTVTDPTGAVVPNASVTATNQATGVKFVTKSSASGEYTFQQLPIGTYTISANAPGFKGFTATGIVLNIDQEYVEAVKLAVGSTSDVVSVQADAVQVDTTDMQLNNIVDAKQIVEYPLLGRSFTQLELILPGVQAPSDRFGGNYSVNGSESQQSSYLINGADTNDFVLNTIGVLPSVDAIGEFNLITGPLNAEYSRNSGAVVSAAIKSGTNQIHGDAFEFYRDTFLNTPGFFNYSQTTGAKTAPAYHQNLFGGTLGAPILRDKLFAFASYQGNRARTPQTSGNVPVPSQAQRTGNYLGTTLSNNLIPGTLNIPGCISNTGGNNPLADTFASCSTKLNGVFPTAAFNPIATALLTKYVPLPNSGTRYTYVPTTNLVQDQAILRLDFNPTNKDQITFLGLYQHNPSTDTLPFTGPTLPGFGDTNTSEIRQFTGTYIRQLSATALNSFSGHYTRFNLGSVTPTNGASPSSLGFAINPQDPKNQSVPLITLAGGFAIGFSTNGPQPRVDQTEQIDDSFSKTIGHHQIKIGYDGRRFNVDNEFDGTNNGSYGFTAAGSNQNTSGNVYLDYLLGNASSYAQGAGGRISAQSYENYLFAQDTWKATKDLTIDIGIGYQIDTAVHNRQLKDQGVNCFIPGQQSKVFPTAPLSLNYPGDPGCNDAQGATTPYKDFGPRIGFAFAPDLGMLSGGSSRKLSIRGGYGIYYNRTEEEGSLQNLSQTPFGYNSQGVRDSLTGAHDKPAFGNPYQDVNTGQTITNPFPATFPQPGSTTVVFPGNPLAISQYSPGYRAPYAQNYQLTIERELPGQVVAIASYVGSVGRHNQDTIEGNPVTAAGHAACLADVNCQGNRDDQEILYPSHTLYPQAINPATGATHFYSASQIQTEASSNYNALELSVKKGLSHGLTAQVSYTYSHSLDTASSYEGAGFGGERGYNQYQPSLNYGNSDFDARHRLVIAPIYTIPMHAGNQLSVRNLLTTGWELSVITTFATGHPFDISYQGGESYALYCSADDFYYTCPDVPNQIGAVRFSSPRSTTQAQKGQYFDGNLGTANASFADETIGQFGNISRNKYTAPGIDNTNAQLSKNFAYSKENPAHTIQLRIESYNVFNHSNFSAPNGNPDNGPGTFGVISALNANLTTRQYQLSGKIFF